MQETQETGVWSLGREDPLEEGMQPTLVFLPGDYPMDRIDPSEGRVLMVSSDLG